MLRRLYSKSLGRSLSFKAIGMANNFMVVFFLLMLLIIIVTIKVSYADTMHSEDPPILEWQKLWDDFDANECADQEGMKFIKLDLKSENEFEKKEAFRQFEPPGDKDLMAFINHISKISVADIIYSKDKLITIGVSGLSEYKRRDIFAFYVYESEQAAQTVFENVVQDNGWMSGWLPVRSAPGRGDLDTIQEFKSKILEKNRKARMWGTKIAGKDSKKLNLSKSGTVSLKPDDYLKKGSQLILYVERYKTVVMIYGFWRVLKTDENKKDIKIKSLIKSMPQDAKPNTKKMKQRAKAIVDERVRFLRVELVDPDAKTKYLDITPAKPIALINVKECVDGCENEDAKWTNIDEKKPVNAYLKMFGYDYKDPPKYEPKKYPPQRKNLTDAYDLGMGGRMFRDQNFLRFDARDSDSQRYEFKGNGSLLPINLKKGVTFSYEEGGGDADTSESFELDFTKLADLLYDCYDFRTDRYRGTVGDVGATIVAEAYHISRTGKVIVLARSKPKHVRYTHVAEVIGFGQDVHPVIKPKKHYKHMHHVWDGKKYSQNDYYIRPLKIGMRLMPNDVIPLGSFDYVKIKHLFLNQSWCIQADPEVLSQKRLALYVIQPTSIRPWSDLYEKLRSAHGMTFAGFVTGGTVSAIGIKVGSAFTSWAGVVILFVTTAADASLEPIDAWKGRTSVRFLKIGPPKSLYTIHVGQDRTAISVLQGEVSFGDASGKQFTVKEGQTSILDETGNLSSPENFDPAALPASVKSAAERLKKDLPAAEASLDEIKVTRKSAEEASAYAWVKTAAERGFFIYRELRKLPIIERLKTIAEKAERKEMVEKYNDRVAELSENIEQALETYADAFRQLEKIDRGAIDAGFEKYRRFLSERNATEQLTVLKAVKKHMFVYFGEKKTDNGKWRRDFADI